MSLFNSIIATLGVAAGVIGLLAILSSYLREGDYLSFAATLLSCVCVAVVVVSFARAFGAF